MESKKNKIQVKIGGSEYTIIGADSEEQIQRVALYVDRKMTEITRGNSRLSTSMAAVLTAVNVGDELIRTKSNEKRIENELGVALSELERMKEYINRLAQEKNQLEKKNTNLQVELARREAELNEVRSAFEKNVRQKMYLA